MAVLENRVSRRWNSVFLKANILILYVCLSLSHIANTFSLLLHAILISLFIIIIILNSYGLTIRSFYFLYYNVRTITEEYIV